VLKDGGKTDRSVRAVPLRKVVLDAMEKMPTRPDSPLLFPAPRGGHIDIEKFSHREWTPALRSAGVPHRRLYDRRHTFATWPIKRGIEFWVSRPSDGHKHRSDRGHYARWLKRPTTN
jgi:integrase